MGTQLLSASMLVALTSVVSAGAAELPDAIKPPAGEKLVLRAHATGSQVYTCSAGADGVLQWTLKGPDAQLHDRKGAVVGQHFAGPTWKYKDGSEVTGKATAHVEAPAADSIPWLLLTATGHTGTGVLANVTSIQRIHTKGGKAPPAADCSASKTGAEAKSSYSADYYFYAPK
jgi:Protein of unknown function (DUF3455)